MKLRFTALLIALGIVASTTLALGPRPAAAVMLYASTGDSNANGGGRIYMIDTNTQTTTLIGDTRLSRLGGIDFSSSGVLYGVDGGSFGRAEVLVGFKMVRDDLPVGLRRWNCLSIGKGL